MLMTRKQIRKQILQQAETQLACFLYGVRNPPAKSMKRNADQQIIKIDLNQIIVVKIDSIPTRCV